MCLVVFVCAALPYKLWIVCAVTVPCFLYYSYIHWSCVIFVVRFYFVQSFLFSPPVQYRCRFSLLFMHMRSKMRFMRNGQKIICIATKRQRRPNVSNCLRCKDGICVLLNRTFPRAGLNFWSIRPIVSIVIYVYIIFFFVSSNDSNAIFVHLFGFAQHEGSINELSLIELKILITSQYKLMASLYA